MLSAMRNAFRVPDLRRKILFTLFIIAVYRLGSHIPNPGVDHAAVQQLVERGREAGGVVSFLNLFSGGALTRFAIFGLGIMPYITASIIMQLLAVVIPRIEEWQKQGEVGYKKITQWTRYQTIVLALIQSTGLVFLFHNPENFGVDLIPNFTPPRIALIVLTMTAGTGLIMWLGELITQRGIGNGMSVPRTTGAPRRSRSSRYSAMSRVPTGSTVPSMAAILSASRRASVTPRVRRPTKVTSLAPPLRSRISWAMRLRARSRAAASRT